MAAPLLDANGLTIRTQPELQTLLEDAVQEAFPDVDLVEGPEQQLIGVLSEELAIAWETIQAVLAAGTTLAQGVSLDQVTALTGTIRAPATRSQIKAADASLDAGITLPLGSLAAVDGNPDAQFRTKTEVTNSGGSTALIPVDLESLETGPVAALATELTVIVTPVTGWNSITNPTDAELGTNIATDVELRLLRETELAKGGTTPLDAIRADLQRIKVANGFVSDVTDVTVFQNVGDIDDADGRPPHSVEAVILGGDDQDIADELLAAVGAGIQTFGTTDSQTALDSQGVSHLMAWTRPAVILVFLEIDVDVDGQVFDATLGPPAIEAALIAFQEANLDSGDDVILTALHPSIFGIAGVEDVTAIRIGIAPSPTSTVNLVIAVRDLADFDTSRILVTTTVL